MITKAQEDLFFEFYAAICAGVAKSAARSFPRGSCLDSRACDVGDYHQEALTRAWQVFRDMRAQDRMSVAAEKSYTKAAIRRRVVDLLRRSYRESCRVYPVEQEAYDPQEQYLARAGLARLCALPPNEVQCLVAWGLGVRPNTRNGRARIQRMRNRARAVAQEV